MKHQPKEQRYRLTFVREPHEVIEGTAADIARGYCKLTGIRLYILPELETGEDLTLYARLLKGNLDALSLIASLKDKDFDFCDLESAYRLFFESYLQPYAGEQWTIKRLDKNDSGRSSKLCA